MSALEPAAGVRVPAIAPAGGQALAVPTPRFLDEIPPAMAEGVRLPLLYRLAAPVAYDTRADPQRAAESGQGASSMLACNPFYKPISRCVGGRP